MKKIFTLFITAMMALGLQAKEVTIYVQAPAGSNIYFWNIAETTTWPGEALTEQRTVNNPTTGQNMTFYVRTFEVATSLNIIFNKDGAQTKDLTGITTDRYYIYDGEKTADDITEQFAEIPDAEITGLTLPGNHNGWDIANSDQFTVIEKNKTYQLVVDLSNTEVPDGIWQFKLGVNGSQWVGFYQVTLDAPNYVVEAPTDGNFEIDLADAADKFTFTATWAGGKNADEGWTIKIVEGDASAVSSLTADEALTAPTYNLAGQRVDNPQKGVFIVGGRKVIR